MTVVSNANEERWRELACSPSLALLLDLDGTLIELADSPEDAVLDADAILLLSHLVNVGIHVVVVSGRPKASIEHMRSLVPNAWWVAEHGSWRWDAELSVWPGTGAPVLDELREKLAELITRPGTLVERKSQSLCIHWRLVDPSERGELVRAIEIACDEWLEEQPGFERINGIDTLEVRERGAHKGSVVRWLRERLPRSRVLAIGDDASDEDMFAELDEDDASVRVGPRDLHADAQALGVPEVRTFLRWIAEARRGRRLPLPIAVETRELKRYSLLVLSNRTPAATGGRAREVGGLVSALEPALRDRDALWLGWSGQERGQGNRVVVDANEQPARARFDLPPVVRERFYAGFCNRVLWPLFHGFPTRVRGNHADWEAYVRANQRFARHAFELAHRDATIWVHDYHLLLVARALRALGHEGRIGLFLHIPFPARDVLDTVPWANDLVAAMTDFDLLGFQTEQSSRNFLTCVRPPDRNRVAGAIGVFPATIDPEPFHEQQDDARDVAGLRGALADRRLIIGVDRLDYSKGIPERLDAFERMLERFPEWRRRVVFLQISVPSRAEIPDYADLRMRVEGMVGRINGRFGDADWVPVRYLYRSYEQQVLAQLYRLADVGLVTPLRDGMNLVAKEFVAAQDPGRPGVLVLSQYAGAAETLASALITNPFHPEGMASDIDLALRMALPERTHRHRMLLTALEREGDARKWAQHFLDRLAPRLHTV
jgi:trehalose 6-phosphate synthase